MPEQTHVSLATLAEGAAGELFDRELLAVLRNISDPNTPAKAKRAITFTLVLVPTEDREQVAHLINVSSKLAPVKPTAGTMFLGEVGGRPVAVTFNPRQSDLFPETRDPAVTPMPTRQSGEGGS